MYLYKLSEKTLSEWRQALSSYPDFDSEMKELSSPDTKIVYSFDEETGNILYEAITPSSSYFSFLLTSGKQVFPNPAFPTQKKERSLLFAYFLANKERKISLDREKSLYLPLSPRIGEEAYMDEEEAASYSEAKKDLLALKASLKGKLPSLEKSLLPPLSFSFLYKEESKDGPYEGRIYLLTSLGKRKIGTPALLLNAYRKREKALLDGHSYNFSSLPEIPSLECLIARAKAPSTLLDCFYLSKGDFLLFLSLLQTGDSLVYGGVSYRVKPKEEGKLAFEDGRLRLPYDPSNAEMVASSTRGAIFDKKKGELTLLEFPSEIVPSILTYLSAHPSLPSTSLDETLAKESLGYLSPESIEQGKGNALKISYSLEALRGGTLCGKTVYSRGNALNGFATPIYPGEKERKDAFLKALSSLGLPENGYLSAKKEVQKVLGEDLSPLAKLASCSFGEGLIGGTSRKMPPLVYKIYGEPSSGFSLSFSFLGKENWTKEETDSALEAYGKGQGFFLFRGIPLSFASLSGGILDSLLEMGIPLRDGTKITMPEALRLEKDKGEDEKKSSPLNEALESILSYEKIPLPEKGSVGLSLLRPYQKSAVKWMKALYACHLGGVLSDEMGLGKTLESIAFLSLVKEKSPILVVAPKSVLYNWKSEFARFDPEREVLVLPTLQKEREEAILGIENDKSKVILTSYDSLRNDVELYKGKRFSVLLLDEAQSIANAFAKKSLAVKEIDASARFALTGTPIQNSLLDLWSIFDFILPGYFPPYAEFKATFGSNEFASEEKKRFLEKSISPFLLRRTKKEVLLDLPKREESNFFLTLSESQRSVYEEYLLKARGELAKEENGDGDKISVLAAITRLRQICVDPGLFLDGYQGDAVKIAYLLDSLDSLLQEGHKALVFSSFVSALEEVDRKLQEKGISHYLLKGSTGAKERLEMASSFNSDPEVGVMLVSLKAGGTGLNLIGADTVFLLDPWWNLSAEEQAFARAHRIGQDKNVTVFRLIASNSVEERMLSLQARKKELGSILGGITSAPFSKEDFAFLLS